MSTEPTATPQESLPTSLPQNATPPAPATSVEDDFGNESLGERQAPACSLEEGCIVCQ